MFRILLALFFIPLSFAQQIDKVDFLKCNAILYPNFNSKSISGELNYEFKVKSTIDTIRIDAKNMSFTDVMINGRQVAFKNNSKELVLYEGFKKGKNKLTFQYNAKPKQTLYFTGTDDNYQIWTQGQGKYTSHWLPSFDDVNEKVIFGIMINYYADMDKFKFDPVALSNGKLNFEKKTISWSRGVNDITRYFQMQQPMSSYLVMLAIGNFAKQETKSKSGTSLEFYVCQSDYSKFEPTYRYSKQIFDFLEQEIGVKYPWGIYRQVPVRDFLYAGMENTTSTIFSQDFVVDSIGFNDRNYVNVNAHELAHQWFGNFITAQSGKHHWLQEGFATYYALLAERHLFGDDYFYEELNEYAEQLIRVSKTDTIPVMNEKASSLSFYKKGAWALHVLREDIGVKLFQKAVKKYLKKYQYKNVNTDDFLRIIKEISGYDVENFKKVWLETAGFDRTLAQKYLNKNNFIQDFSTLRKSKKSLSELVVIMQSDAYYPIKQYVVFQTQSLPYEERKILLDAALATNSIPVRQTVAETMQVIPLDFKAAYETLLWDDSYITNEIALNHLCDNFPDDCLRYLEQTKGIVGNNDMSFRLNWLTLAINSENASEQVKISSYNKLVDYASDKYESSVRQNALELLLQLNPNDEQVIELLFKATVHHKWQFTKFCRDTIREHLKNTAFRSRVEELSKTADENRADLYLKFLKE
jgi:aminopeptidase N